MTFAANFLDGYREEWESLSCIRKRVRPVLARYADRKRVLVVCHGMLIRAMTGVADVRNAQIVPHPFGAGLSDADGMQLEEA